MYRLLQVNGNGTTGNLIFNEIDDVMRWLFWAGLDIVSKHFNTLTGWTEVVTKGKHDKEFRFRIVVIGEGSER